jgi:beta-galactosidase/beta-glucuronidase
MPAAMRASPRRCSAISVSRKGSRLRLSRQVQQGLAIKTAVDPLAQLKPHCMGTLYWQLNDTWPVCSWSSLDYGGGWKAAASHGADAPA